MAKSKYSYEQMRFILPVIFSVIVFLTIIDIDKINLDFFEKRFDNDEFGIVIAKFEDIVESSGFGSNLEFISIQKCIDASLQHFFVQCSYIRENSIKPTVKRYRKIILTERESICCANIFNAKLLIWGQGIKALSATNKDMSSYDKDNNEYDKEINEIEYQDVFYHQTLNIDTLVYNLKNIFSVLGANALKSEKFNRDPQTLIQKLEQISEKTYILKNPTSLKSVILLIQGLMILKESDLELSDVADLSRSSKRSYLVNAYYCIREAYLYLSLFFNYHDESERWHFTQIIVTLEDILKMLLFSIVGVSSEEEKLIIRDNYKQLNDYISKATDNYIDTHRLSDKEKREIRTSKYIEAINRADAVEDWNLIITNYNSIKENIDDLRLPEKSKSQMFFYVGLANANLGNLREAENNFKDAFLLDPSRIEANVKLGLVKNGLNEFVSARGIFSNALNVLLNEKNTEKKASLMSSSYFGLAENFYNESRIAYNVDGLIKAIDLTDSALACDSTNFLAHGIRGDTGFLIGRIDSTKKVEYFRIAMKAFLSSLVGYASLVDTLHLHEKADYIIKNKISDLYVFADSDTNYPFLGDSIVADYYTFKSTHENGPIGLKVIYREIEKVFH